MTSTDTRPASSMPTERLTSLGSRLRAQLDGPYAHERAAARAQFPASHLLRNPEMGVAESREWVLARLRELQDAGFGSAGVPDGADAVSDPLTAVVTFETLAHGDLSVTIKSGVQFGLFGGAVMNLGTPWHHETFLPDITALRLLGAFAMTELGHGSDVANLETTFEYLPETDEIEVHSPTPGATKAYLGNAAAHGTMAAVFGQLSVDGIGRGVHAVLVPIRDGAGRDMPGVTTGDHGHKGGLLGVDNGTLRFDHVRVPRRMLLNRYGGITDAGEYASPLDNPNRRFFTMLGTLVRGRVCIAAGSGIAARRALSIAVRHALRRRQFPAPGRPEGVLLLDYQTHQRRLLPLVARAYALGFAQNELTGRLVRIQGGGEHSESDQRELELRAAGLKAVTSAFANRAVQEAREACGGAGYMSENRIVGIREDVDVFATFEGDNTVLMQLVAKGMLGGYAEEWKALDRAGVVQAMSRLVGGTVAERTSARLMAERLADTARGGPEQTALVDRGWHALMFEERERHSLGSLARRIRAATHARDDRFEAVNRLGGHLQFVAHAHVERLVLEAFVEAIDGCADRETRDVMERVCSLYALSSIHEDRAWFMEHQRISTGRAKAIGDQIDALCRELRPHALPLVEGLGAPAAWLGAAFLED
ncbi:acyl-CoA dehydrogenase [Demequina capsici]|uniref:Acyl-CoA dehydrogenase n=1 Tax=Demequina capsici TaxID=3075620 RepID=A0AA96FFX7_9MICO|nr:acyl-CoA dehydrogenase [Demequina sp. PMTSA13]WNM28747.1 acyl-CoA dehydrogenase [Demequina sp. PMTSA13]